MQSTQGSAVPGIPDRRAHPVFVRRAGCDGVVLATLAVSVVALQIAYPLVHGTSRRTITLLIVGLLALACETHVLLARGMRTALAVLAATAGIGLVLEVLGVATGFPFGAYAYSAALGPRVLGVPLAVGLAWTMLAWPAAAAARRLASGFPARVLIGAWALASADLFLDPQLVATGAWTWRHPSPHLPGVTGIPLTNYAGWLVAAVLISAAVQLATREAGDTADLPAVALYLWLWVSWAVAQSCFLHLPASAAWGTAGMGLVAVPLALSLRT